MNLISWWKIPLVLVLGLLSIGFRVLEDIGDSGNRRCDDLIEAIRGR